MTDVLSGYTIGVTADRRQAEQVAMLTGRGADCIVGPTIRTLPLRPENEIRAATEALLAAPPDLVVLTTGIGVRSWLEAADAVGLGERLRAALRDCTVIARGPKARGAAFTADLEVSWNAPNATYAEIIEHLAGGHTDGVRVAVQLDGSPERALVTDLEALGLEVLPVPVYQWTLPDDVSPAEVLVRAICDHRVDAVTFTTRPAIANFMEIAEALGRRDDVTEALHREVTVFCVGPVCAGGAVAAGLGEPYVPETTRLGAMVSLITDTLSARNTALTISGLNVDIRGRRLTIGDSDPVTLTGRERQVLSVLLERPGVVYSKSTILRKVWGRGETDAHVLEVTVGRLRRRLGEAGAGVETVMRRGYRVNPT